MPPSKIFNHNHISVSFPYKGCGKCHLCLPPFQCVSTEELMWRLRHSFVHLLGFGIHVKMSPNGGLCTAKPADLLIFVWNTSVLHWSVINADDGWLNNLSLCFGKEGMTTVFTPVCFISFYLTCFALFSPF